MQDKMAVDLDGWGALIAFCESERRRIFALLEPLEEGTIHTGKRGQAASGNWIDTTNDEIQRLRKAIADIDSTVAQVRGRAR